MGKSEYINFKVNCPRDQYRENDIQIIMYTEDGKQPFPLPCNGCDWLDGSDVCQKCAAALTLMFYYYKDIDTSKIIVPDFSLLKKSK